MPAIITTKFRINNSEQFHESFTEASPNVYYIGLARPQAFATPTRGDGRTDYEGTDSNPITPGDTVIAEFNTFDDLLAAKKITSSDISFCIPRRNWTTGTTYDKYEHNISSSNTANSGATNLFDSTFVVMNSSYAVYKVIDNDGNTASTVEPTSTSNSIFTTSDNYKWKYMYSLTSAETLNFMSTDFIHVSTDSTVTAAAVDGALDTIEVVAGGSSYNTSSGSTISAIPIRGDGSSGKATVVVGSNAVTSVTITTAGSGYTFASVLASDIGSVSGADIDFIISPPGGHASDAVAELGGFFVMMNVDFATSESGEFNTSNDFRRIALLRNPTDSTTGSTATASTLDATKSMTFSGTPGSFQADEKITQASTGAVGFVVDFNSTTKVLRYIQPQFTNQGVDSNGNLTAFSSTNTVTGATSGATGTPSSHDITPELTADTGDILYIENRKPISRASDQTENVKLIVEF